MHPRIAELMAYIDAELENLRAAYESVPVERRGVRPSPDRWSPAENVQHLVIVERRLCQRLSTLIEEARALPPETDTSPIARVSIASRALDRTNRFKTSEASEPRDTDAVRVWDDLLAVRAEMKAIIARADGLALGAVTAPHPALGVLSGYDWIVFVGSHAARHADQIREMNLAG